jgi:transposase
MKPPMFIRPLSDNEQNQLLAGLRSPKAFTVRRCQILLASSRGERVSKIANNLGCATQTVRNSIRDFNAIGLSSLEEKSRRPKTVQPVLDESKCEDLRALLHTSPRALGKPTSNWTLQLIAEISFKQGLTDQQLSIETIRQAIKRMGVSWKRAKKWITSPDPQYALKKSSSRG